MRQKTNIDVENVMRLSSAHAIRKDELVQKKNIYQATDGNFRAMVAPKNYFEFGTQF